MLHSIENTPHTYRKDLVFIGVDKHESKNNKEQEIKSDTSASSPCLYILSFRIHKLNTISQNTSKMVTSLIAGDQSTRSLNLEKNNSCQNHNAIHDET
jgi:hypothetical protein